MRKISMQTLMVRCRRFAEKNNLIFKKHKAGTKDYLMNGDLFAMLVNPYTNAVEEYWDYAGFEQWCRDNEILRIDEEIAE